MSHFEIPLGASAWILSEATIERLGWVLLHSLWQFLLIAVLALVVLRFVKRSSASMRYAILVFMMAFCVVLPIATWFSLPTEPARVATEVRRDAITQLPMEAMQSPLGASDEVVSVGDGGGITAESPAISKRPSVEISYAMTEPGDWWMNARGRFRPWLMSIVTVWIMGVMIGAMRPLLGWIAIRRWRRVGTTPVSREVTELMLRLSDKLAVRRTVQILQSSLVHVPLVFGCVRPLILLPASLLTSLPTSQLEAIIAHELAHVRRHDFLVNFMQTIIETFFFYHPAIWWLSRCIRIERENCCDDLVVSVLCNRVDYGRALLAVEEDLGFASTLALGARGGSLLARVQRLAGLEAARRKSVASVAAMITSGFLIAGTAFMIGSLLFAAGDNNESLFGKESNGLQIRLVPLSPDVSDESPELQKIASSFKRSQEMTFAVQLKNMSRESISLAGIRYGDGYAVETKGKLNTAMLAPHWFEFEFTGMDGKRILRTPHRDFYQGWFVADNSSVHVLAPGESLIEVLRPAKFMEPMDYDLLPGKYRVQVHYRGPNDSLRENVRKHWPDKPILNAWPHQATSNVSDFSIEEASNRTKPEELIWGKPVEGLQAALEYRLPDDAKGNPLIAPGVSVGSHLGITFHLRNVSDKPITFVSETGRQGDQVHVTDESGKEVDVKDAFFTGEPIDVAWKLMPGEVAQLSLLTPGLRSLDKPGKYKVRYTVRFNSRIQKDETGNMIFPRPGDYDQEVYTGETPLFLHETKKDLSANDGIQSKHSAVGVLPNGDTVELVHLAPAARWGITGKRVWWKPDGTLDEETNATEVEPEMIRRIANDRRLFAIHMSSKNLQPSIHLKTVPPMQLEHSVYADFTNENGKPARSLSGQFGPADTEKQITLQVGVTSEPWGAWQDVGLAGEPLVPFDDKQNYAEFYQMIKVISAGPFLSTIVQPRATVPLLGEPPVGEQSASNWVSTVVTLQMPEDHDDLFAFEFRAVDTDSATNYANGSTGTDNSGKTQFWFNGDVLREKLTKYQFRLRPYRHWVTFEDVANQSSVQTNPKVKVEAAPAVNSTVVSNEAQPAKLTVASESANNAEVKVIKPHRVVDAQGKPVAGAKIDCLPSMKYSWLEAPKSLGSTVTDSGGWFDYPNSLPSKERFYVYVSSDGFLERIFQANNGEAYVLEKGIHNPDTLVLRRPVTVSGQIIGIDGKPLADAEIAVDYMFDNGWAQINGNRVKSDAEGRFAAKGVEPANAFVRYETPYKTNEERMPIGTQPGKLCIVAFTATDGQQKDDIVLDLSKCNCIVEGSILDHEDKGVPNRWMRATIASAKGRLDESITVKSDAEGRFRFEGLTADEFNIGTDSPSISETVKPSADKPAVVRLTTYVQGKAAVENDPNPPVFGEPSESGIAGGIRVRDGAKPKLGNVITAEVLIKNKSDRVKMFAYSFAEQANLRAFDGDKSIAELNYSHFTGITVTTHYRLEPNQEAVVGSFNCGLHDPDDKQNGLPKATFQIPCRAGQALTLRCDMSGNLFGRIREDKSVLQKDAPLSTGALSITVMPNNALAQIVRDTARVPAATNRGSLKGRFVFDGTPPTPKDYFGNQGAIDWSKPQQPGPDGRMSGVEGLYREFLAKGVRPETKAQDLVVGNDSGVANIYVWASSKNMPWEAPAEGLVPVNVEFRDGKLTSRCIKVVAGQQLQLVNRDPVDHSLAAEFMKARNSSVNFLVKPQSKYERELSFPVAESLPTRLGLGRAPWASGVLFVHSSPFVAITQSDGTFEIENFPIGEWEFQVWHETAGYLLPNKGVFKHTILGGDNNLGTKLLNPEAFGIREAAKAVPVKPENREQVGTVQGKPVYRDEIVNGNLLELFTNPIWTKYKQEHRETIEPTENELELARSYFSQQHRVRLEKEGGESKLREKLRAIEDKLSNNKLSEEEANKLELEHSGVRARLRPFDPSFANFILDNWKLQKHLYESFGGGRILWQQAGQEAFDAMRTWLELQEKNGEFKITDTKLRAQFYHYWNQDHGAFLTSDEKRIREEFLQPPWIARVAATNDVSQKILSPTNAKNDIEKTVLDILRKPFIDDPDKGTWQLGAHDIDVHWKLSDLPQRTEVILTLFKVVDRTVPSSMHERWLAMGFLGGADPKNLVPRLNKEIEIAFANPAKPFAAYHEIEMLGRLGENARSSLPLLIKLLDSTDGVAYNLALDSLTKIGARSPDVMNELAKHTDDPITVYQLGRYGQMAKSHGPLFIKLLDSPSNEIHTWAAKALVQTGFDEARGYNVLIADVAAGKSENRCRAATALAALGSQAQEMIPRLRPFENDPDPQVAKAVRESIVRMEKDDRIFTHAEEATKREKALEASAALNPQIQFNLRILGGEEKTPIAGIEIVATNGYGDSQKKFGPFLTDASGTTLCKLPQGFYTLHLNSKKELPFLPYEKFWIELPTPGMKTLDLRVTGIGVEKWLGGEVRESGFEPAKSQDEPARITFTLQKPIELILRAVDKDTGRGLPGATFYLESAAAEDWAHPIDGANIGASQYRDGEHKFDPHDYQTDADGYFKRFISDGYLRRPGDSDWGPKFGVWKSPEGYEVVEPKGEVNIDFPAENQLSVEQVFKFREKK